MRPQEPIAIVGMGCRFPQAENPQAFWKLLCEGQDAIREIPADRWNDDKMYSRDPLEPGKTTSRWGGFLDHIDQFDCRTFRILPKEARQMDPQHRLLLEVAWEALEDAGMPIAQIEGSQTSVFIGCSWSDFLQLQLRNWSQIDGYTVMGNAGSFAANRLSYHFNLKGPSLSLDSGCSSSLTALYLACQSLWMGEASHAIAGGVNLMIAPESMLMVSKTGLLSPQGRCKTLDAQADGYVRGEGAGIVILKPLADVKPSERVYAVIRGLAVNHNGFNDWIIASSQQAQEALLRDAYHKAGVSPHQVDYVELHGTGFQRGDAMEVNTLGRVVGAHSERDHPCLIGSVKTNIGHLEAASGMASLIKVALALYHHRIPPTLHLQTDNPAIPFATLQVAAAQTLTSWPEKEGVPLAGITTLGLSGANSHAVLSAASQVEGEGPTDQEGQEVPRLLPLSARSDEALRAYTAKLRDFLLAQTSDTTTNWRDICYTSSVGRAHHDYRLAVVATTAQEAATALTAALQEQQRTAERIGTESSPKKRKLLFVFTSTRPEETDMDNPLLLEQGAFHAMTEECERVFQQLLSQHVLQEVQESSLLSQKVKQEKAHFVFQIALAALWKSWGILPETVLGEGPGKLAAAYVAGIVSLKDAFQILLHAVQHPQQENNLPTVLQKFPCLSPNHPACLTATCTGEAGYSECTPQKQPVSLHAFPLSQFEVFPPETSRVFLTLGQPSPLSDAIFSHLREEQYSGILLSSLSPHKKADVSLLEALSALYTLGYTVNWPTFYTTEAYHCISLPTYAWQRARLWPDWLTIEQISLAPEERSNCVQKQSSDETASGSVSFNRTTVETLVYLWADVLGLEQVEPDESFFTLGGHSLLGMQLLARVCATFQVDISMSQLFQYPTPDACATLIDSIQSLQGDAEPVVSTLPTILPDPAQRYEPFPLTDMQQAYWVGRSVSFEIGNVSNHGYIEVEAVHLDLPRFQRALNRLIERHDMLRAVLLPDGRQQVLEHTPPFEIPLIDVRQQIPQIQEQRLLQVRESMDHQMLPVEQWPAFVLVATLLDEERVRLHLSVEVLFVDAWSMNVLIQELIHLYQQPEDRLPPLHLTFRDYVLTEQALQDSALHQKARTYWHERLASLPPSPTLPLVCDPRSVTAPRFVHREARLDQHDWQHLKARGAQVGLTPSALLLTAFAQVIGTWSTSQHFSLNLSTFNRRALHQEVNTIVGDFTSLLVLAVDHRTADSFENRARRLQGQLWSDLDHSQYSGVQVLRELAKGQGDLGRAIMPIVFTSMLIQDVASPYPAPWHKTVYCVSQTPQVWLDHQVLEVGGELVFHWQCVDALFPVGLIESMFEAYCQLLHQLASSEPSWLTVPSPVLPAQYHEHIASLNATRSPVSDQLLPSLFLEQAARRPEQAAVMSTRRTLSYQELSQEATILAWQLREAGGRPNMLVAVVMEKGWEQVVGVLGVLLSGAAYLPIDAHTPAQRLAYLLEHAQVTLVVTQSWLEPALAWPEGISRFCVDTLDLALEEIPSLALMQRAEDLAYVIYTSGSTGLPKGVMIDHRGAVNTILDINERFAVGSDDRVLALSSLSFDLSVYDLFGLLAVGGGIVMPDEAEMRDPAAWWQHIAHDGVTLWNSVPALLQLLVEYAEAHSELLGSEEARSLSLALLSGDWIPVSLPDRMRSLVPGIELISLGGATEASIWSILYPIGTVEPQWTSIPYGKPMRNQQWYVLNEALETCPVWVPGHLYIGGVGLARGYWRDEEKTQASFILHPHMGIRLYRTGDLGRYLPDGTIEFLGRQDLQVKVQGYRVELGEIEAVLARHPLVQEAVVTVISNERQEKRLAAAVVARKGASLSGQDLRQFVQEYVPGYMVPSTFTLLDVLPLSANGKVDRHALLSLMDAHVSAGEYTEQEMDDATLLTRAETLAQVGQIVMEVLKKDQIAPLDNLVECGMTSLDIFRIANLLEQQFQFHLDIRQLFQSFSIAAFAAYIDQSLLKSSQEEVVSVVPDLPTILPDPAQRYEPFPLTDMQQAYWVGRNASFEIGNVSNHGYIEVEAVHLDLPRFQRALNRLIERHDMLRAVLLPDGRQQVLEHTPPFEIPLMDVCQQIPQIQEQRLLQVRESMDHQMLPVEQWPAFALVATLLDEERVRLHLSVEVLFVDAWSMNVLIQELIRLYHQPEETLPPLHLTFRDYVLTERALQDSPLHQKARTYWHERLASLPPSPTLPLVCDPRSVTAPRFVHREARLGQHDWQHLKARAAQSGLTPSGLLLTAFAEIVGTWSASQHFGINLSTFNRLPLHEEVNAVVGDFTSLLVLAVDHRVADSFENRARRLQGQLWSDLDHSQYSGVQVLRELAKGQGDLGRAIMPIVFTSMLIQDTATPYPLPWQRVTYSVSQTPQVWLDHQVLEMGGELVFHWQSVDALFPAGLIEDMFASYCQLLHCLATSEQRWSDVTALLLPQQQLMQIAAHNSTQSLVPDILLPSLFLEQAARRPEQAAVISTRRTLTYQEVLQGATLLGWQLREAGARPNTLVAVVMEKGWEQVVGVLGVLLSGAAYLPIDAHTPTQRLAYLLEHAQVTLVVTQSWVEQSIVWPQGISRICVNTQNFTQKELPALPLMQQPEDLAYVIYTSGSTGLPKGVMIDHRGAVNTILDINERFAVSSQDRVLALSSLSFDLSVYDLFGLLAAGGSIVMPDEAEMRDPAAWWEHIIHDGVTLWNSVPALLQLLVEYAEAHPQREQATHLRLALLSGDWIPVHLPDRVRSLVSGIELISLGGATEASIWSILYPIGTVEPQWKSIPYGKPMRNQQWYVLNEALETCPVWVPGQLYVGGVGLARGYWRDEEKTQASFLTHPHTGIRLYRTGDLGRYLPDGTIEFLGRQDLQVKVQGYRVELGEIEAVLARHPLVQEAVVTVLSNERQEKRLAAAVVARGGAALTGQDLRQFVQEYVPGYMVPGTFTLLDALPLSANGKVDRHAIRALLAASASGGERTEQDMSDAALLARTRPSTVAQVSQIVRQVLTLDQIAPLDNLVECGMTSLDIFRIANLLEQQFQFHFDVRQLFLLFSVAAIAAYIDQYVSIEKVYERANGVMKMNSGTDTVSADAGLIMDPQERERFKIAQHNIREVDPHVGQTQLVLSDLEGTFSEKYSERRSRRTFAQHAIPFKHLSKFLECLRQVSLAGKAKYQWGSAGGLYPVQVYLYSKPERIESIEGGIYYYNPVCHDLALITPHAQIDPYIFGPVNYHTFKNAAFALFLIGQLQAIEPLYGELSRDFCLLEAGLMTQLLETAAPDNHIALCQIGGVAFEKIQQLFAPEEGHIYLHCLLGGALDEVQEDTISSEPVSQDIWIEEAL